MDKLIANASVGLAKASMNRRGFLGRLARAAGGAAVLTAGLATVARADHCGGSHHFCQTGMSNDPRWILRRLPLRFPQESEVLEARRE